MTESLCDCIRIHGMPLCTGGGCPNAVYVETVAPCGCKRYSDGTKYICVTHASGGVYP